MIKDLEHYLGYMPNIINKKLCKKILTEIKKINKKNWQQHTFYNPTKKIKTAVSGEQELSTIYYDKLSSLPELNDIIKKSVVAYLDYIKCPWFDSLQGYSHIRFNKYSKNKKMAEHCDHIHSMFDGTVKGIPILSVLGFLNDDYKGGELVMFQDKVLHVKAGSILIFPSNFLYPHRVEPVVKGTRYSFVCWCF